MTDATACLGTCGDTPGDKCAYPISPDALPNHPACGWTNNDFAAYSSTNLVDWRLENPSILPADSRPNGIYFRPKVMHNAKTNKYVLWMNYVTEGWGRDNSTDFEHQHWSTLATAVSSTPQGPYTFDGGHLPPIVMGTGNKSYVHGDFGVFTDPDSGQGYVVYNAYDHRNKGQHSNSVDLLTDDFTRSTGKTSGFFAEWTNGKDEGDEAQVMLKHKGTYWVIVSQACCFCSSGASAFVYSGANPLGPFTLQNDIQRPRSSGGVVPPPPPPPVVMGPVATSFCGGAGGQEFSGGPYTQVVLQCLESDAEIAEISWASWGTFGCEQKSGIDNQCQYTAKQLLNQWTDGTCTPKRFAEVANVSAVPCPHTNLSRAEEILRRACQGKRSCAVDLSSVTFPDDPCFGVYKSLFVAASCSKGNGRVSTVTPPPPPPSASAGITVPAQQSFLLEIPAGAVADTSEPVFMWGGDRWQSAPDRFKSHDFLVWVPFYFTNNGVEPLSYNKTWELALA